jgi:hypothetical protein
MKSLWLTTLISDKYSRGPDTWRFHILYSLNDLLIWCFLVQVTDQNIISLLIAIPKHGYFHGPFHHYLWAALIFCGLGGSVSIATGYGLDTLEIESRWGRDFSRMSRPAWGPPSLLYKGYRVFPGGVKRLERVVDHPPPPSAEVENE